MPSPNSYQLSSPPLFSPSAQGTYPKSQREVDHKGKYLDERTFCFQRLNLKTKLSVKNPHHPVSQDVQADEVNFKFIGAYSTDAVEAFRAGKVDIDYMSPPTSEIMPLKSQVTSSPDSSVPTTLWLIRQKSSLKDKRFVKP